MDNRCKGQHQVVKKRSNGKDLLFVPRCSLDRCCRIHKPIERLLLVWALVSVILCLVLVAVLVMLHKDNVLLSCSSSSSSLPFAS